MKIDISTFDGGSAGSVELDEAIFGLEPRPDLLQRCVRWQLAKRQAGTHAVKNRSAIDRTTKKIYKQKGTGNARHGAASAPQFRGGGRAFGPQRAQPRARPAEEGAGARAEARAVGEGQGRVAHRRRRRAACRAEDRALKATFGKLGLSNALIIAGAEVDVNFGRAARNIPNVDVLPVQGINVYDILRRDKLVLTRAAVDALEARFR